LMVPVPPAATVDALESTTPLAALTVPLPPVATVDDTTVAGEVLTNRVLYEPGAIPLNE